MQRSDFGTLGDVPRDGARRYPVKPAIVMHDGGSLTYRELDERTDRAANMLIALGVERGDRVAILARNSLAYVELLYGSARAGAAFTPVNWRLAPPEIAFILDDSRPAVLFVDQAMRHCVSDDAAARIVVIEDEYAALIDAAPASDPAVPVGHADIAMLVYTSGTTGHPKAAMLHHGSFIRHCELDAPGVPRHVAMHAHDVMIVAHPLFHIGSLEPVFRVMFNGGTVILHGEFDAGLILHDIATYRATTVGLVPTALQMVLRHPACPTTDTSSLDRIFYGASPIPQGLLLEALERFGCGFIQAYGMTECGGTCVMLAPEDHHDLSSPRLVSAGRPILGAEVRILGEDGQEVPRGETGEIAIRGSGVMAGYWNRPDATAETLADGWLRSGDAGSMDEDGYVTIRDRMKDMIISGGENIYPIEVESAVYSYPGVSEVAVVGVPDVRWGEAVKAVVVAKPGAAIDDAALIAWVRTRIATYKVPKSIDLVDELPKSAAGKILRREIKARYWTGHGRMVN